MRQEDMKKVLEVGVQLSSERDVEQLLAKILDCVMELANCDAGTLYLLEEGALHFKLTRNHSLPINQGAALPPVPLKRDHVCAYALLERQTVCIEDVRCCQEYDFTGPARYDAQTGYRTQSMLVVPMFSREGEPLGVLQLINALDEAGNICRFAPEMSLVLESVASQAAITLQNVRYIRDIKGLLDSFVRVMTTAIEERSQYNANHSRRMAQYGEGFAAYLNKQAEVAGRALPLPPERLEELLLAIWLHDVGKLATPLEVMDKAERLLPMQREAILARLRLIRLQSRLDHLEGRLSLEELQQIEERLAEAPQRIVSISQAGFLSDEDIAWLEELAGFSYLDEAGAARPWLEPEELAMLSIRRGTLSPEERQIMERHVVITDKLLGEISFGAAYSHVRGWAAAHHELLNGGGYPKGLTAEALPYEVRIITILDIFDALVADDRPYKPGMPPERALKILTEMAEQEGKLDLELVQSFIASKCWETA